MRLFVVLSCCFGVVFAGESLVLTSGVVSTSGTDPNLPQAQDFRIEFQLHSWTSAASQSTLWELTGVGFQALLEPSSGLRIIDQRDGIPGGTPCDFNLTGRTNVLVRVQRLHVALQVQCELWNVDGTGYANTNLQISSLNAWPYFGSSLGGPDTTADLGFLRVFTTTVPLASRPPTTADGGNWTELKFDAASDSGNTLTDSSGQGHSITLSGPVHTSTPNQLTVALIRTVDAPFWTAWLPFRAGHEGQLDGSSSYSLADTSSTVSYFWNCVSGPTTPTFSSNTAARPVVTGLIFGTYRFVLVATASNGATSTSTLDVGAVATDSNNVVVYPDSRLYAILGPTIALGKNPWEYVDDRQFVLFNYWSSKFKINGGTWDYEPDLTTLGGVPRLGTAYVAQGSDTVNGIGTNFADVYCGGNTANGTPVTVPAYIVIHVPQAGTAPLVYSRYLDHCNGQNQIVMAPGWTWEVQPTLASPGYAWGTYGLCSDCGNWVSANSTTSNLNYYDGQGLGSYVFYYRSGFNKAHDLAQWVADRWYRGPGFNGAPRDIDLTSAMIRASIDTAPPPAYPAWPYIRSRLASIFGCSPTSTNEQIADAREDGSCLVYRASQALLDPDTANQAIAQTFLVNSYNGKWKPQQQSGGNWLSNDAGGDTSRTLQVLQGSRSVQRTRGAAIPSDYCGENIIRAVGSTVSVGNDRVTITGSGGANFVSAGVAPGDVIAITGTLAGQLWTGLSHIASVTGPTTLVLAETWRGDIPGGATSWRVYNGGQGGIRHTGYYSQFFVQTDANGNFGNPFVQDADNWYVCTVVDGDHLTLDKPYTASTAGGNVFRSMQTQNLTGVGSEPFMMGYPLWGSAIATSALAALNPTVAAGYNSLLTSGAGWLWNVGRNSITNGMWYGVQFSNCFNLLDAYWPAFECSGGNVFSISRDYAVETLVGFSRQYAMSGSSTDKTRTDTLYNAAYAAPGFATPMTTDPNFADLLGCCDVFTQTKYYGQVFSLGQAASWPAVRVGGVAPADNRDIPVAFNLASIPNATKVTVTLISPNGTAQSVTCNSSPCSVTGDARQGNHLIQLQYKSAGNVVLATGEQQVATVQ